MAAVHLALDAVSLAEHDQLVAAGDPAIAHVHAAHVRGSLQHPLGAGKDTARGVLRGADGDLQLARQPAVGLDARLDHGVLQPVKIELFQLAPHPQGLFQGIDAEGVEHEHHIGAYRLAHGPADLDILLREAGELRPRLPFVGIKVDIGVHLVGLVALPLAIQGVPGIVLRLAHVGPA